MKGEVFGVVSQSDGRYTKLDERMNKQYKLAEVLSDSECPESHTVVELPRVDILDSFFGLKLIFD